MGELFPFPENISTFGGRIDTLFAVIVVITGVVFVVVEAALLYFVVKYRHREGRKAYFYHGNKKLEIFWTSATAVIVLALAIASRPLWLDIKHPDRFPAPGLELIVTAKQFEWNVTYPGADGRIGTADDFVKRNQLHVPAGVPVRFTLASEDVIHSFWLPQLRLKQDAVPGMHIPVWFEATTPGTYEMGCAELCGLAHYRMRASVTVHSAADFATWQQNEIAAAAGGAAAPLAAAPPATPAAAPAAANE
jgi:cytochrome c oxidase subunit 2